MQVCVCVNTSKEKIDFSTYVNDHALVHSLMLKMGFKHMSVFVFDYVGML